MKCSHTYESEDLLRQQKSVGMVRIECQQALAHVHKTLCNPDLHVPNMSIHMFYAFENGRK